MKIQLFGNLVDLAGKNHVEVENQSTTDKLIELLVTRFPELKDHQFLIAVNQKSYPVKWSCTQVMKLHCYRLFPAGNPSLKKDSNRD